MTHPHADVPPGPADPERRIAVAHAHRRARRALATLFAIDERLGGIVSRAREPGIGLMRLLWWRDALAALGEGAPPAEPLLVAAAGLRGGGIVGQQLAAMAEGWEALLDDPALDAQTAAVHARERGGRLFALAGEVLGGAVTQQARLADAGAGWALADCARHFAPPDRRQPLLDAARVPLERAMAMRWPGTLRPLGMLAALALQDARLGAEGLQPRASPRRLLRMLGHRWTGA